MTEKWNREANASLWSWECAGSWKHKGSQTPVLLYSYSTISPPGPLFFWSLIAGIWEQELLPQAYIMLSRKKPTHIYATLFHQITVILQTSLSIFSQNLSDYSSGLDLAEWTQPEWTSTLETQTLPCFREFVTVHEIIILAQGQISCVLYMLFPSFQTLLLISGMGEAELSAKVQKPCLGCLLTPPHLPVISSLKGQCGQRSCQPNALPSELPVPYLPTNNRNKAHWGTRNTTTLLKKRWSESTCSSLLHGTKGLKIPYTPSTRV